jgi:NADH:ubiquinone oxidoreductase subunit 6 (subunit J)
MTPKSLFPAFLLAGVLWVLALGLSALLASATWEFMTLGAAFVIPVTFVAGIVIMGIALVLGMIARFMERRNRWPRRLSPRLILSVALLASLALISWGCYSATPRQRYDRMVAAAGEHASEIDVAGFDSFLAQRWLLGFKIPPEQVPAIVSRWNLKEIDPIALGERLRSDVMLGSSKSPLVQEAPDPKGTRCFVSNDSGPAGSSRWITFVFREADRRAWFYRGYQN